MVGNIGEMERLLGSLMSPLAHANNKSDLPQWELGQAFQYLAYATNQEVLKLQFVFQIFGLFRFLRDIPN